MAADAPVKKALTIDKGFSFNERVIVYSKDTGLVRNLAGFAPTLIVKANGITVETLIVGDGLVLTPATGVIDITVSDTKTGAYTWTSGEYALSIDDGSPQGNELLMFGAAIIRNPTG